MAIGRDAYNDIVEVFLAFGPESQQPAIDRARERHPELPPRDIEDVLGEARLLRDVAVSLAEAGSSETKATLRVLFPRLDEGALSHAVSQGLYFVDRDGGPQPLESEIEAPLTWRLPTLEKWLGAALLGLGAWLLWCAFTVDFERSKGSPSPNEAHVLAVMTGLVGAGLCFGGVFNLMQLRDATVDGRTGLVVLSHRIGKSRSDEARIHRSRIREIAVEQMKGRWHVRLELRDPECVLALRTFRSEPPARDFTLAVRRRLRRS